MSIGYADKVTFRARVKYSESRDTRIIQVIPLDNGNPVNQPKQLAHAYTTASDHIGEPLTAAISRAEDAVDLHEHDSGEVIGSITVTPDGQAKLHYDGDEIPVGGVL